MIRPRDIALAKGRIQVAFDRLEAAEFNLSALNLRDSLHSAYYSAYTAIRVLLNLEHEEQRKHRGNISKFQEHYIKTKIFDVELSRCIEALFISRNSGDYDMEFVPEHSKVVELVKSARIFVEAVYEYLDKKYFSATGEQDD